MTSLMPGGLPGGEAGWTEWLNPLHSLRARARGSGGTLEGVAVEDELLEDLGVPLDGPAKVLCDNESVVKN